MYFEEMLRIQKRNFEALIDAARDSRLPYSFYCNENYSSIFVVKHDYFGRELLLEVHANWEGFWFRGRNYHEAAFAVNAAVREILF